MQSLWRDDEAQAFMNDDLSLRVYTSRLLGRNADLVLHGGGNTSVKSSVTNLFGDTEEVLYVKGSGWDLISIEAEGFAPVRLDVLQRMAQLAQLSDSDMVKAQRAAMLNPYAPNPSVEAILHAVIPLKYVDHTHADAVVTISNTPEGEQRIRTLYGDSVLIIPYTMPGFNLAKQIAAQTRGIDWSRYTGMILLNHGVFSFADDAKTSYERMIGLVTQAENYLAQQGATLFVPDAVEPTLDLTTLATVRRQISQLRSDAVVAQLDTEAAAQQFANHPQVDAIATRGPLTPDHVIRTKRAPVILGSNPSSTIEQFVIDYHDYFNRNTDGQLTCLNPAPCWAVWQGQGLISFGRSVKEARIVSDIKDHTIQAIQQAEQLGGWQALPEKDIFEMEYWELEQAKLKKAKSAPPLQGKIALVTGAASGIGKACAEALHAQGAAVLALDINPAITGIFNKPDCVGKVCDVSERTQLQETVDTAVRLFGGLDIVVSNAGIFPPSEKIADMNAATWDKSMAVNLTSHQALLQSAIPYLRLGINPAVVIIASKNVPAPGPGVSAYSVAKAGLTQLARVAALELARDNIRVNVLHPNAVFDTAIWTPEVLEKRAKHYGLSVEEYKTNNLLKIEVTSQDVAALACAMAGSLFGKTTGAQLPIDGGNERVI